MFELLHLNLTTSSELMSGAKLQKWVHQKPTNQPTNLVNTDSESSFRGARWKSLLISGKKQVFLVLQVILSNTGSKLIDLTN